VLEGAFLSFLFVLHVARLASSMKRLLNKNVVQRWAGTKQKSEKSGSTSIEVDI
jgi:hypothetical protein